MKLFMLLFLSTPFVHAVNLFEHVFVHCTDEAKTKKMLMFNAFTNPELCPAGFMAYPASETICAESNELINKCPHPIECKAKFACRILDQELSQREMIKKVKNGETIPLYQVVEPLIPVQEEREFEVEVQAPVKEIQEQISEEEKEAPVVPTVPTEQTEENQE